MRTACTVGTLAVFSALIAAPLSPAQNAPSSNKPKPATPADAVVVYSSGIEGMLVDPKDAGLVKALKMLDERVAELPRELNQPQIPGPALQMVLQLLMNPMSLRAGLLDMQGGQPEGPPFYAQLSFYGSPQVTGDFAGRFAGMLAQMGAPLAQAAPDMAGMQMVDANGVPLYYGTMKAGPDSGGSAFVLAFNKTGSPDVSMGATGLPSGVKPSMGFMLDARQLQPLMDMLLAQAGPEADLARKQLTMSGLYGPNALQIVGAAGQGKDRSHGWAKLVNQHKVAEAAGMLPHSMLSAADFKRIPADATCAQITKLNFSGLMQLLGSMGAQAMQQRNGAGGGDEPPPDIFKMVEEMTGINPKRDIADNLGETIGCYASDTTGGGGLASMVAFVEVKNADALTQTIARIRGHLNQLAQAQAKGYARIAERDLNGQKVMSLLFPGLPVPLEICWAISDGYLYAAGSPNALLAGIAQAKSGKSSLTDNAHFKEMGGSDLKDAMKVSFIDTPRMIGQGYGLVSMGMSALANAARSPTDMKRDPGIIMPAYNDLIKDAHASVTVYRYVGDDLVITAQADRSALVNACGAVGSVGGSAGAVGAAAVLAGMALPAVAKARENARDVRSMVVLRSIGQGFNVYAADQKDALPTSVDDLVKAQYVTHDMLRSPFGPAPGGSDYWVNPRGGKISAIDDPAHYVIAYDRAMAQSQKRIAVAFLDGHVENLTPEQFRELTQSDGNKGVDFDLP